ncbi:hypothetical protein [Dyella sp. C9]|uniref:ApeI family dehydratase n=1 Tax=Dyella sp. C9 TaxID=2202154 RepID=UPI000DEEB7AC|nr:hypothetical protein [Dyella sp. C9]
MSAPHAAPAPCLPDHPWVAHAGQTAAGIVLQLADEGLAALRTHGRQAVLRVLGEHRQARALAEPPAWRLVDAWPGHADARWIDGQLAQARPSQPEVLDEQHVGDALVLTLRIPVDLQQFDVHFPALPILPGVMQLDWALALAATRLATPTSCHRVDMLKFQRPLRPGQIVQLSLRPEVAMARLHFGYACGDVDCSSGRLAWERLDG